MKILMCVPNISEGRDLALVEEVVDQIRAVEGVRILDYSSDPNHNRSVLTYLGHPQAVLEATKEMASKALQLIDMSKHHGSHPRIGAVDVVPFVTIRGMETAEAVEIARQFGRHIGQMGVPVYYHEDASTRPERKSLANIRKGEYEGLAAKLMDPKWRPDEGPAAFNPKSGATVTGVRFPLVAFNVNLKTTDVSIAQDIAKAVRFINGGYRYVRAIGLSIKAHNMVQVSMNLLNYSKTPIPRVMETIRSEAARRGVALAGAELIGPVPLGALEDVVKHYLQVHNFCLDHVIESCLLDFLA
jgi:glutamate formiminotransferase